MGDGVCLFFNVDSPSYSECAILPSQTWALLTIITRVIKHALCARAELNLDEPVSFNDTIPCHWSFAPVLLRVSLDLVRKKMQRKFPTQDPMTAHAGRREGVVYS